MTGIWQFGDGWQRIVCVGDIHGDLDAIIRILLGVSLIDKNGDWCGGSSLLVLIGDLIDRGPDSAATLSFVMSLQHQAAEAGGKLESLLGNHEMLASQGVYRYVRATEVLALEAFWYDEVNGLHALYRGNSPYAAWLRERPAVLAAGNCLFVHAGIGTWVLRHDPGWINAILSSWVAYFQGMAPKPDESTLWLATDQNSSPLWTRRFAPLLGTEQTEELSARRVVEWLEGLNVDLLVVGHVPTDHMDFRIAFPHPRFGASIALIDTGISRFYDGRLSALEVNCGDVIPHYFERGDSELALTSTIRNRSFDERSAMSQANRDRAR